jgi:hypothetical protein
MQNHEADVWPQSVRDHDLIDAAVGPGVKGVSKEEMDAARRAVADIQHWERRRAESSGR